jgi:hypothetical protein
MPSQTFYPLRKVPTGGGNFSFVNALLTSSEVQNFKRELKSLLEDPHEVADQLDQFLGPQFTPQWNLCQFWKFFSLGRKEL